MDVNKEPEIKHKYMVLGVLLVLGALLGATSIVRAHEVTVAATASITKDQTVDKTLFIAGESLVIDGTINGDVFCAGNHVHIGGVVHGDVVCAAQDLTISGVVDGDVRIAGQDVHVAGKVGRNLTVAGQAIQIDRPAQVVGDLFGAGNDVVVLGSIGRDVVAYGNTVTLDGPIGRNVRGTMDQLKIGESADIRGSVAYKSNAQASQSANRAPRIAGGITQQSPDAARPFALGSISFVLVAYILISFTLVSLVLVVLFPHLFERTSKQISKRSTANMLRGALVVLGTPLLVILLSVTVVGIPLAGLTLLAWLIAMVLSGPVAAYSVGALLTRQFGSKQPFTVMLAGSVGLILLYLIPIIGFFALTAAGFIGTGALVSTVFGFSAKPKVAKA